MKTKLFAMILAVVILATAQTTPSAISACATPTKGLSRDAKKFFELKCKFELAELQRQTAMVSLGTAVENKAVVTVTYRDNTGRALEGSSGWAKHTEKMADIDRRKSVGVEKAKNPGCGWLGCYTPVVGGYGGGYGYGGAYTVSSGEAGRNYVYNSGR